MRVFDDKAVHVGYVQGSVGAGLGHGWSKPIVRTCKEFGLLLTFCPPTGKGDAIRFQNLAMDQVVDWFTYKYASLEIGPEETSSIR